MIANAASPTQPTSAALSFDGHLVRRLMPHRHHMLLLDRVATYLPDERRMVGIKNVSQNDPLVQGHFPEYPIFPGSLLVEAMAQSSGLLMNVEHLRGKGVDPARLADPENRDAPLEIPMTVLVDSKVRQLAVVLPGEQVQLHAHLALQHGEMCHFRVGALVDDREVARGEIMLAYPPYMS